MYQVSDQFRPQCVNIGDIKALLIYFLTKCIFNLHQFIELQVQKIKL